MADLAVAATALNHMWSILEQADTYQLTRPHRDVREPGKQRKLRMEDRLILLLGRHWRRQARRVRERLQQGTVFFQRFSIASDAIMAQFDDQFWETELQEALADWQKLLTEAARDGVNLFADASRIGLDYSLTNKEAAKWARQYAFDLIKDIDKVTREVLQEAVSAFVETPGMTIGDVMRQIPYDETRAQKIGITEITRAYAEGNQLAGEQLKEEFPGVAVIKMWFTNNDERVCPICEPLNGAEVEIDEEFEGGDGENYDNPPAHTNCRCWTTTTTRINE